MKSGKNNNQTHRSRPPGVTEGRWCSKLEFSRTLENTTVVDILAFLREFEQVFKKCSSKNFEALCPINCAVIVTHKKSSQV